MLLIQVFGYDKLYPPEMKNEFSQVLRKNLLGSVSITYSGDIENENNLIIIIKGPSVKDMFVSKEQTPLDINKKMAQNIIDGIHILKYLPPALRWIQIWTESSDPSVEGYIEYKIQ